MYLREFSGGPRRIRTPDPLIRSQVLYPAELSVHEGRSKTYSDALQGQKCKIWQKSQRSCSSKFPPWAK